ncbi:hypothetical protein [Nocardia gamkensis]|uniref:Uncharacterized protein n=1 Tax=Nocardia gamkensis TaxID=352869 RepID=A0A7X6L489_9NOCA|nr:hypothetical protein [Nocardia gamkensis]NKY27561.1 hypothetical protein [Nocardia gamkensis]
MAAIAGFSALFWHRILEIDSEGVDITELDVIVLAATSLAALSIIPTILLNDRLPRWLRVATSAFLVLCILASTILCLIFIVRFHNNLSFWYISTSGSIDVFATLVLLYIYRQNRARGQFELRRP